MLGAMDNSRKIKTKKITDSLEKTYSSSIKIMLKPKWFGSLAESG